jgi:glycosyltransferase involved in cell wall biosynthesis
MVSSAVGELGMFYGDKPNTGQYDNGVWLDVLQIPYLRTIEEASLYKVVIRTLWLDAIGWSKEIRNRYPHVKQVGLIDHPLSAHISRLPAEKQYAFIDDLQYLDGIMVLTEEEREFYSVAVPSKPVEYVGLPFPFSSYEDKYGKFRDSEKEYIGLGVGASDNDRNFVSNILAFQKLQLKNPDLQGVFLSIPSHLVPYCAYWADRVDNLYIHARVEMSEYYEMLSRCKFVINLTDRNTPGRLQGEAAFFGVPTIGANRLELQEKLWPQLSVKPYELESAVKIGQHLLDHPEFVAQTTEYALKQLRHFDYKRSAERFNKIMNRIKGEELATTAQSK